MLILTRRPKESITITTPSGEIIEFKIMDSKGSQIKVGIDAPDEYSIVRNELLDDDFEE